LKNQGLNLNILSYPTAHGWLRSIRTLDNRGNRFIWIQSWERNKAQRPQHLQIIRTGLFFLLIWTKSFWTNIRDE